MTASSTSAAQLRLPTGISLERFLGEYWQQRPLLMPQALSPGGFPLDADELAGLACEAEIESRLVIDQGADRSGPAESGVRRWQFTTDLLDLSIVSRPIDLVVVII